MKTALLRLSKTCPLSVLGFIIADFFFPVLSGKTLKGYILGKEGTKCEDPVLRRFITSYILNN